MEKRKKIKACMSLLLVFFLTGCFALPAAVPILPPPVISMPEPPAFTTVPVSRGTVRMMTSIQVTQHTQASVERLYFAEGGLPLLGIFVSTGDLVQAGDIVAALDMPEIAEDLEIYTRRRARLALALRQVEERLYTALHLAATTGNPVDDLQFIERRADVLAELAVVDMYIAYLRRLDEGRYLRSPVSGIVTEAWNFFYGMQTEAGRAIVLVADQPHDEIVFVARGPMTAYLRPGNYHRMIIENSFYLTRVIDPYVYDITHTTDDAFLVFADAPPILPGRVMGRVELNFMQVDDVLYIPTPIVRRVGGHTFVYVIEDGLRTMRDVEIGLVGNVGHAITEVVSGLYEGELVIR